MIAPRADKEFLLNYEVPDSTIHAPDFISSKENVYNLLKMLPFAGKLKALQTVPSQYMEPLKQAILSDLIDEQKVFLVDRWSGNWGREKLLNGLTALNMFVKWDWSKCQRMDVLQDISNQLLKSTDSQVERRDYLWFFRRRRILASVNHAFLQPFLAKI